MTDDDLVDVLLQGGCAAFALGAWDAAGRPDAGRIGVLLDGGGAPDAVDGRAVHAFWWDGDATADAAGPRDAETMADAYGLFRWRVEGPMHPEAFLEDLCGEDGPFEADEDLVAAASDLVRRRPDLVGIPS